PRRTAAARALPPDCAVELTDLTPVTTSPPRRLPPGWAGAWFRPVTTAEPMRLPVGSMGTEERPRRAVSAIPRPEPDASTEPRPRRICCYISRVALGAPSSMPLRNPSMPLREVFSISPLTLLPVVLGNFSSHHFSA